MCKYNNRSGYSNEHSIACLYHGRPVFSYLPSFNVPIKRIRVQTVFLMLGVTFGDCKVGHIFLYFLIWPILPTECRCRGLSLRLITLNDTHTLMGHLWAKDQPVVETTTWEHTIFAHTHRCPRRHSNPQSQKASGHRPTYYSARPKRMASHIIWTWNPSNCLPHLIGLQVRVLGLCLAVVGLIHGTVLLHLHGLHFLLYGIHGGGFFCPPLCSRNVQLQHKRSMKLRHAPQIKAILKKIA